MKHEDFSIGTEFKTDTGVWRCTDTGTRTIIAIKISDTLSPPDPSWFNGPPYAVAEQVFDEKDITACEMIRDEWMKSSKIPGRD